MCLAKTGSDSNSVTNWISLIYRLRRSYTWFTVTVQIAENCDLS